MAIELTVEDQQLLADTFARAKRGMHAPFGPRPSLTNL